MRVRLGAVVGWFTVFALLAAGGIYVGVRGAGDRLPPLQLPVMQNCVVEADGRVTLNPEQAANAATIAAVGISRGLPHRAVVVALATAWQESKLENLAGGDRDSIGLFQQRPSQGWGSPEQIADPRYASRKFYDKLVKVPGWQQMRVTDAAQAVQFSAFPEAYEKWTDESEIMARALTGAAGGAVACTATPSEPPRRGAAAAQALVDGLSLDWPGRRTQAATPTGVTVAVNDPAVGWQYAHWLVAHSVPQGVKRVRYADREWTAGSRTWSTVPSSAAGTGGGSVVADVYP